MKAATKAALLILAIATAGIVLSGCASTSDGSSQGIDAPTDRLWEIHDRTMRDFSY